MNQLIKGWDRKMVQQNLSKILDNRFKKKISEASNEEIYLALL